MIIAHANFTIKMKRTRQQNKKSNRNTYCAEQITVTEPPPEVLANKTFTCPAQIFINNNEKTLIKKQGSNPYEEYTGYINYKNFPTSMIKLMGSNRIVNQDRVKSMIEKNISRFEETNTYEDFNTVKLLVDRSVNTTEVELYIADGQHRLHVAQGLLNVNPDVDINIHVTITIVNTEKEAIAYLMHFQNCLPPDYRLFSMNVKERHILQKTLDAFRAKWPKSFIVYDERQRNLVSGNKIKNYRNDVERPNLSDGIISDFVKGPCAIQSLSDGNVTSELLDDMNDYLRALFPQNKTEKIKCVFGLLRSRENTDVIQKLNYKMKLKQMN